MLKGFKHSEETRKKMSEVRKGKVGYFKGKKRDCYWLKGLKEEKNFYWKGDKVGYLGLHAWVIRQLGQPTTCEHCGKTGLSGRKIDWANKSHEYKRHLNDWLRLCRSCHIKYDKPWIKMSKII